MTARSPKAARTGQRVSSKLAGEFRAGLAAFEADDYERARKHLRPVLKAMPDNVDANHLMGLVALRLGDAEPAERFFRTALAGNPSLPLLHNNLGEALREQGRMSEALEAYHAAIRLDPNMGGAFNNLSVALCASGDPQAAGEAARKAIALMPKAAMGHMNLGQALEEQNDRPGALNAYETAVKLEPRNVKALVRLAECCVRAGLIQDAMARYGRALELAPNDLETLASYGDGLRESGNAHDAVLVLQDVVARAPRNAAALHDYGRALNALDLSDEALKTYQQALKAARQSQPEEEGAIHSSIGSELLARGAVAEGLAAYRAGLAHSPDAAATHRLLAFGQKHTEFGEEAQAMERLLASPNLSAGAQAQLNYGLAKVHEDLGQYAEAFAHTQAANAAQARQVPYDPKVVEGLTQSIARAFSPALTRKLAPGDAQPDGWEGPRPIFIVGLPRSGSTLLEQILASHPQVFATGEVVFLDQAVGAVARRLGIGYPEGWADALASGDLGPQELGAFAGDYAARVFNRAGRQVAVPEGTIAFTDKMLSNYKLIGAIRLAMPHAKIIHSVRDPLECCFSIYKNFFADTASYTTSMAALGHYQRHYRRIMAHWHSVFPGAIHDAHYERLVADPETETRALLAYLGLPFDAACLEFHTAERAVKTLSATQVRQPIYASSVKLAERYGDAIQPLIDALEDGGGAAEG